MNALQIWNTLSGSKQEFNPIDPRNVRMYVCGPTVYDRAHIGNARPAVVFDLLYRLLREIYGASYVTYVRNITDIDDKINNRATELRDNGHVGNLISIAKSITNQTIEWYHSDLDTLNVLNPNYEPRATDFISEMINLIENLIESGNAYEVENHVLFSVDKHEYYGELTRRKTKDMIAGARVEIAPYKRNKLDFVLWKPSTSDLPGWPSPWGRGRPGWHIECSAMSLKLLGSSFDIHGGGADLAFPHHENELAQNRCINPQEEFARYWMHNGLLTVNGQKMAKSLGNFLTIRELIDEGISGVAIRYALLSTHYRQQMDWTLSRIEESQSAIKRWQRLLKPTLDQATYKPSDFFAALTDDLNTPKALSLMHGYASSGDIEALRYSVNFLGLIEQNKTGNERVIVDDKSRKLIDHLLSVRTRVRSEKNYTCADYIRSELEKAGVLLHDRKEGTEWEAMPGFESTKLKEIVLSVIN